MTAPVEVEVGRAIGARVDRKEDRKLLLGQAQWVDNMRAPDMVYLAVVRSPYAHARITKVDVAPALAHADVVAAWSGADLAEDWLGSLPCAWIPLLLAHVDSGSERRSWAWIAHMDRLDFPPIWEYSQLPGQAG